MSEQRNCKYTMRNGDEYLFPPNETERYVMKVIKGVLCRFVRYEEPVEPVEPVVPKHEYFQLPARMRVRDIGESEMSQLPKTHDEAWEKQTPIESPNGWIQWKGTDVCMDIHCTCGHLGHVDADFAYYVQCSECGRKYFCNGHIELIEVHPTHDIPSASLKVTT